ncbi:MAG: hypothetical protein GWP19_16260 [Planctomycetia bacterium]|nr:hypothetical protein [Planctomycetia bacterium]
MNTFLKNKILALVLAVIVAIIAFVVYSSISSKSYSGLDVDEMNKELIGIEEIDNELTPEPLDTTVDFESESQPKTQISPKEKIDNSELDSLDSDLDSVLNSVSDLDSIEGDLDGDNLKFDLGF